MNKSGDEGSVRWDDLFADLAGQAEAIHRAARADEIAERYRIEVGSVGLRDRLIASRPKRVAIQLDVGRIVTARIDRVGLDWALAVDERGSEVLLPTVRVVAVRGLDREAANPNTASIDGRLSLRSVLRAIARDRSNVSIDLADGSTVRGTIDRVAADHCDVASRSPGERRETGLGGAGAAVVLAHIVSVTRRPDQL